MVDKEETGYGTFIFNPFCDSSENFSAEFEKLSD